MGVRGPLPKPADQRVRRNKPPGKAQLPMEGYSGPSPEWPLLEGSAAELIYWDEIWRTPQAAQWVRMHIDRVIARYVRLSLIVEQEMTNNVATAQTLSTIAGLEDRLGLSPLAMMRLQWEVVADEVEEQRENTSNRKRIRAVDSGDSGVA